VEWDYPLCVMGAIFTVRIFADTDQPVLALMSLSRRQTSSHTCPATRKSVCITNISGMVKINGTAREPVVSALRLSAAPQDRTAALFVVSDGLHVHSKAALSCYSRHTETVSNRESSQDCP